MLGVLAIALAAAAPAGAVTEDNFRLRTGACAALLLGLGGCANLTPTQQRAATGTIGGAAAGKSQGQSQTGH